MRKLRRDIIDMTGVRVGAGEVLSYAGKKRWNVRCDCGAAMVFPGARLRTGTPIVCWHDEATRFWSHVEKAPGDGCWVWTGYRERWGYGVFAVSARGTTVLAHRWAWVAEHGDSPELRFVDGRSAKELDHLCRNRACVRPSHLEMVTHRENVVRRHAAAKRAA